MLPGRRRMNVNSSSGMIVSVGVASLIVLAQHSDAFVSPSPRVQRINNAGGLMQKEFNSHSYRSLCQLAMNPRITMHPHANLAVAIDQPLLPRNNAGLVKFLLGTLTSNISKAALIAFIIVTAMTIIIRSGILLRMLGPFFSFFKGAGLRIVDQLKPKKDGVPMTFTDDENDGWGVCTLRSKRKLGKTNFVQYEFDLPKSNYVLPLKLGQQCELCCLDNKGNVAKGDFYVYHSAVNTILGRFSIVAPNKSSMENEYDVGPEAANFVRVLKSDLKVGDEIAVKPGDRKLEYRGSHFPVTDMVYLASGVGIVPILEQVRAVLPNGQSSVKSVTVIWIDEDANNFDVISDHLEREYHKYTTKLAVSCVVDNMRVNTLADNRSIANAIPEFIPGTMAVLSGPKPMQRKAITYLTNRGYPEDCICML